MFYSISRTSGTEEPASRSTSRRPSSETRSALSSKSFTSVAPSESALRRALVRAERGVRLDAVEAETLLHARGLGEGEPLDRLLTAAGRVRDAGLASAGRPGVVTYSRKVFIPLTHLCRD